MTAAFFLPATARRAIVAHAAREHPHECCGLLVGQGRSIVDAIPMRNVEASPTKFRIDDREHIALRRTLRTASPPLRILGVYHSHPSGPARPSPTDVAEAFYPEWVYVIAAVANGRARVRGFVLDDGRMRPIRLLRPGGPS